MTNTIAASQARRGQWGNRVSGTDVVIIGRRVDQELDGSRRWGQAAAWFGAASGRV